MHVSIDSDSLLLKTQCHHNVRCLAPDTREGEQIVKVRGDGAAEACKNFFRDSMNCLSLDAVERNRIDRCLDHRNRRRQHCLRFVRDREKPIAGHVRRLILCPQTENAGNENGIWGFHILSNGWERPLANFFLQNSNDLIDVFRTHE